ncbi:MAG: SDR family oxidoreductase [Actinomycetaceae bacterium]|nr:SDR family oxidoreductase [Actinomycetaceae bacterium]
MTKTAVVTGASSGIGWACAAALQAAGWQVVAVARRKERLAQLAAQTGCEYVAADLTKDAGIDTVTEYLDGRAVQVLVNNAGGAFGVDSIAEAVVERWQHMFEINVLATVKITRALLPAMRREGGTIVFITSTAAHDTYPGGGGYVAAKHAERVIPLTMRQELAGEPVRIVEIAPGMVHTEEFSLNRLGSQEKADAVYAGVQSPLQAADVAEAVRWCVQLPAHVNIDSMIIRPVEQATNTLTKRLRKP